MTTTLSTRQVMSLYSGCAYCDGPQLAEALKFVIGNSSFIAAWSFYPYIQESLLAQFPWLRLRAPRYPKDLERIAKAVELACGVALRVKDNPEQLNGIKRVQSTVTP